MFFFELYGNLGCWLALLLSAGLILTAFAIFYSARHYRKPTGADGDVDEHAEPGIPLVLKGMYLAFAIWLIVVTILVIRMGISI